MRLRDRATTGVPSRGSVWRGRWVVVAGLVLVLGCAVAVFPSGSESSSGRAVNVLPVAPAPTGAYRFGWMHRSCSLDAQGRLVARASARVTVLSVPKDGKTYYQKTDIRIDTTKGTTGVGQVQRKVEAVKRSHPPFTKTPTYSTPGVKSVIGPTIATQETLTALVQVYLMQKRKGPDKTVWGYYARSPAIPCKYESLPDNFQGIQGGS